MYIDSNQFAELEVGDKFVLENKQDADVYIKIDARDGGVMNCRDVATGRMFPFSHWARVWWVDEKNTNT